MAENEETGLFPNPRFDDTTRFNVVLHDDDPCETRESGAELKTPFVVQATNLGGEKQVLSPIDERISDDELLVQCDLSQIIHGTMVDEGSPATLLVFQFAFVPLGHHRRFKMANITITFSAGHVHSISPSNTWTTMRSAKRQELSHSISPGLEAAFGPGKAAVGYTWQFKEEMEVEGHSRVVGLVQTLGQAGTGTKKRKNTVVWALYENEQTSSGIPSFLQTAALLKREKTPEYPLGEEFSIDITISGEVDSRKLVKDKWRKVTKNMSGKDRKGEAVVFDPAESRGTVDDTKNLSQVRLDDYKQLVDIRPWVENNEKPQEQEPASTETTEKKPPSQQTSTPAEIPTVMPGIPSVAVAAPIVEDTAKTVTQPSTAEARIKRPHTTQPETVAVTLADATFPDSATKEDTTFVGGCEKQKRFHHLQEQLSLVRREAKLVSQIVLLLREERKLVQEIEQLRD